MQYPYMCPNCGHDFDVIKSVKDIDSPEACFKCGTFAERYLTKTYFYGASDWNNQEFNPGLGCVVNNNVHKKKILAEMAARGRHMEEIGNEPVQKMHAHFDKMREDKINSRWENADSIKANEESY